MAKKMKKCPSPELEKVWGLIQSYNESEKQVSSCDKKCRSLLTAAGVWEDKDSLLLSIQAVVSSRLKYDLISSLYFKFPEMKGKELASGGQPSPKLKTALRSIQKYNDAHRESDRLYSAVTDELKSFNSKLSIDQLRELQCFAQGALYYEIGDMVIAEWKKSKH